VKDGFLHRESSGCGLLQTAALEGDMDGRLGAEDVA
jgi:hypothetical protein